VRGTRGTWGGVEFDFVVEVVILFGGLGIDGELLRFALVGSDDVVVEILASCVVHVFDGGQRLVFHSMIFLKLEKRKF
jgi:hypothetical protein